MRKNTIYFERDDSLDKGESYYTVFWDNKEICTGIFHNTAKHAD